MNSFELKFFEKYIPEWQKIKFVVHEHWIKIIDKLFLTFWLAVFVPTFIYFFSITLQELIPFWAFETYLILIYIKIIYDIFDWYNDVWIITDSWVAELDWALFKTNVKTVDFENIEWLEIEQNSIWDKILNKWDIVIHKIWDDVFVLEDAKIPYKAINEIEKIREEMSEENEEIDDRFDLVMDALSWVVKDYLWKNWLPNRNINSNDLKEELLDEIKSKKWTVDLR